MDVIAFVLQMLESGSVDLMAFMRAVYCFFCLLAVAVEGKQNLKLPDRWVSHISFVDVLDFGL